MTIRTHIRSMVALLLLTFCAACDVHEFPEPPQMMPVTLDLRFSTEWEPQHQDLVLRAPHTTGDMRYVVKIYPTQAGSRAAYTPVASYVFLRPVGDGYDCTLPVDVPVGRHDVRVWADLVESGQEADRFYNTEDFTRISLQGEHCGNTDARDAFRGVCSVELTPTIHETEPAHCTIEMERPLAKFEIITTDLDDFIKQALHSALQKAEAEAQGQKLQFNNPHLAQGVQFGMGPEAEFGFLGNGATRVIDLEEYKVVFFYSGFMPSVFSMFTDKPVDSATGVSFPSAITQINQTEASLGFDYVFVNGKNATVAVSIGLFNKEGEQLAMSNPVEVILKRSHHTIVRGRFLTQQAGGGIVIDPSFDDEFNVVLP